MGPGFARGLGVGSCCAGQLSSSDVPTQPQSPVTGFRVQSTGPLTIPSDIGILGFDIQNVGRKPVQVVGVLIRLRAGDNELTTAGATGEIPLQAIHDGIPPGGLRHIEFTFDVSGEYQGMEAIVFTQSRGRLRASMTALTSSRGFLFSIPAAQMLPWVLRRAVVLPDLV